ncbi:hypothetical protein [Sphingomonas solaris]|uniref:DUF4148 domain-containing protein n=1 Tax=Alterirhizorhabdus solaris TaxID=2529389 RepID=A0A558QTZ2_9SPHN|nr:hypothetical protein [Sphingomonas solaris]TVV70599.1 hypothetical protein FOY91_18715 [Sphingomonas solaris]
MKKTILTLGLAALTLGGVAASAEGPVNARQLNQERRIDAGKRSGKLTHAEAARLKSQQAAIKREEDRMRARHGGKLTAQDKRIIHARQEQANRAILQQKQDSQRGRNHLKIG